MRVVVDYCWNFREFDHCFHIIPTLTMDEVSEVNEVWMKSVSNHIKTCPKGIKTQFKAFAKLII